MDMLDDDDVVLEVALAKIMRQFCDVVVVVGHAVMVIRVGQNNVPLSDIVDPAQRREDIDNDMRRNTVVVEVFMVTTMTTVSNAYYLRSDTK
jgi:hypothetical protein